MLRELTASVAPRKLLAFVTAAAIGLGPSITPALAASNSGATATPIQHLVIIFQENVSFDHYFGTYPNATNPAGSRALWPSRARPT
jgi:phospholipase C